MVNMLGLVLLRVYGTVHSTPSCLLSQMSTNAHDMVHVKHPRLLWQITLTGSKQGIVAHFHTVLTLNHGSNGYAKQISTSVKQAMTIVILTPSDSKASEISHC